MFDSLQWSMYANSGHNFCWMHIQGMTALQVALQKGHGDLLSLLLRATDVNLEAQDEMASNRINVLCAAVPNICYCFETMSATFHQYLSIIKVSVGIPCRNCYYSLLC